MSFVAGQSLEELPQGVDAALIEKTIVVVDTETGRQWTKADAIAEILRTTSRLDVALLFLKIPFFRTIANFVYDQIAARSTNLARDRSSHWSGRRMAARSHRQHPEE